MILGTRGKNMGWSEFGTKIAFWGWDDIRYGRTLQGMTRCSNRGAIRDIQESSHYSRGRSLALGLDPDQMDRTLGVISNYSRCS